tara:strand:+ start:278 stop:691 length:414 start_codon:yes stop_codon:yes gene_type:complete
MLSDNEKKKFAKKISRIKSTTEKIKILLTEKLNSDSKNKKSIKEEIRQKVKNKKIHKDIFYGYQVASDMWDLAGDKSADLNYYSKRLILTSIYSNILFKILTCKSYDQLDINKDIDKSLKGVKKFNDVKSSILKQFS